MLKTHDENFVYVLWPITDTGITHCQLEQLRIYFEKNVGKNRFYISGNHEISECDYICFADHEQAIQNRDKFKNIPILYYHENVLIELKNT